MSSPKKKTAAKKASSGEPTRDEKAAFVKAMLRGIEPGSTAAKKTAAKRAGIKDTAKANPAIKKAVTKKAQTKAVAPKAAQTAPASDADQPKVEILRKISAPPKVETSPKSAEAIALAKELEKAVENGDLEFIQPHAVQALIQALIKFYAANDENDNTYPILQGRMAVTGTDAMVACGALLRAVDLQVFELGMFQSWSGR